LREKYCKGNSVGHKKKYSSVTFRHIFSKWDKQGRRVAGLLTRDLVLTCMPLDIPSAKHL